MQPGGNTRPSLVPLLQQMSPALRWSLRRLFGTIHYPRAQVEAVAEATGEATPVFVLRSSSFWLALCFCHVAARVGLVPLYFIGGVDLFWQRPLAWLQRRLAKIFGVRVAPDQLEQKRAAMAAHVTAGRATLLVLPVGSSKTGSLDDWIDYLQLLLELQARQTRPIVLLPHTLVSRDQAGRTSVGLLDRLFGDNRRPGPLRLWSMLLVSRHGSMRLGAPIDLASVLAEVQREAGERPAVEVARKVRQSLHHRIDEEERVVAGPLLSAYDAMAEEVLHDPALRATVAAEAQQTEQTEPLLEVKSAGKLREIAANYDVRVIRSMEHVLYQIFHRIYDGIAIDEPGLARVIEASRKAPVVFCPSHKSHVDYLVLSYVLWTHGIAPPHVAAGANLNFFPLGSLFRRCGAFFLRRSFRDDTLYAATLRAYISYLVRQGTSLEFFLEGTRSRTGKLLPPRFGLLRMIMQAWRENAREDVLFVPVSIDYERIIEAKAYGQELRGASKRTESLRSLLGSTRVLRSRYGRLQVQFGEPISLSAFAEAQQLPQDADAAHETAYRAGAEKLGYRILHGVAMACSVTPVSVVATVLLSHPPNRGIAQGALIERAAEVTEFLEAVSARLAGGLEVPEARVSCFLDAVQKLAGTGEVTVERAGASDQEPIYFVGAEARLVLDYHKNAIMNYFASAALVSRAALRDGGTQSPTYAAMREDTLFLSRLFKREFIFRADADFESYFDAALGEMDVHGLLQVQDDGSVETGRPEVVAHLAGLLDSYVQAYYVAAQAAMDLRALELTQRAFVARALERARRAFLEGDISRPEAASRTLMETALSWLIDEGVLAPLGPGKRPLLRFAGRTGQVRLQQLIDALKPFL